MRRRVWTTLIVGLLILNGFGSVWAGGQSEGEGDVVTLDYWAPTVGPQAEMVAMFEKQNPGIHINLVDTPADEMRELITAAISSGTGPDVFYFELGLGQVQPLLDANLVIPLDEAAKRFGWRNRISDFALAEATHQGKLWAVPNEVEFIGMWYNKSIFKELGVSVPKSWDEMMAIAKAARDAGYQPFAFGDSDKWPGLHRIGMAYQWNDQGKQAVSKALFDGAPLDSARFVAGIKDLMKLDGKYWPNAPQLSYDEAVSAFIEGKAAMFHMGTWLIDSVENSKNPENFGVFVAPKPGTSTPSTVAGAGGGWYINASTKHVEEALKFLNAAISDESMKMWVKDGFVPPVDLDLSQVDGVPEITRQIVDTMNSSLDQMGYFIHHFVSAEQSKWIQDGYQGLLLGQVTPEEFAQRFQELGVQAREEGFRP